MCLQNLLNSTKKFLRNSLLVGALSLPLYGDVKADTKVSFSADFSLKYEPRLVNGVGNIPLKIRYVPNHPDDEYKEDTCPIKETSSRLRNRILIGGKAGGKFFFSDNTGIVIGVGLDFNFDSEKSDIKRRNYYDKKCAPKIACEPGSEPIESIYYYIHPAFLFDKNTYFKPYLYSEVETQIAEKIALGFGYELFTEKILAENGWERSNKLEAKERNNLVDLIAGNLYTSLKILKDHDDGTIFYSLDFGLAHILKKDLTNLGKNVDIDFNEKDWFAGLRIGKKF